MASIETHLHVHAGQKTFPQLHIFLYVKVTPCHTAARPCESSRGQSLLVRKALKVESGSGKLNTGSGVLR